MKNLSPSPIKPSQDLNKDNLPSGSLAMVKTVSYNKFFIDERIKKLDKEKIEGVLMNIEENKIPKFFELTSDQLMNGLNRLDNENTNYQIIREAILYLHRNGTLIQCLQKYEAGYLFPSKNKDESELIDYLKTTLDKQTEENKKLQEKINELTKDNERMKDELNKIMADIDGKSKKIAELKYSLRESNKKTQEYCQLIQKQTNTLTEYKNMNNHEGLTYISELKELKIQNTEFKAIMQNNLKEIQKLEEENNTLKNITIEEHKDSIIPNSIPDNKNECPSTKLEITYSIQSILDSPNV